MNEAKTQALSILVFGYMRDKDILKLGDFLKQAIMSASQNNKKDVAKELEKFKDALVNLNNPSLDMLFNALLR